MFLAFLTCAGTGLTMREIINNQPEPYSSACVAAALHLKLISEGKDEMLPIKRAVSFVVAYLRGIKILI